MAKKIRIGDVVEIPTARGLAYAQFSHQNGEYGALLRVLPGFHECRPGDFVDLVLASEAFVTFFPLQAALNRGIFVLVANHPVPEAALEFPLFRAGSVDPASGKVKIWWLWDGHKEWKVGELTPQQQILPVRGIWNDTLLVERIESGWRPINEK